MIFVEVDRADIHGDVAQVGERCVRNAQVGGSSPLISIKISQSIR